MLVIKRLENRITELRREANFLNSKELESKADYLDKQLAEYKKKRHEQK